MRIASLAAALALSACASPAAITTATLASADAATSLIVGERVTQETSSVRAQEGMDPVVTLTLRHADGRTLRFQQANHASNDLMAQRPGGPLAQIMGLFGEEAPVLYHRASEGEHGAPFLCAPEGPAAIGVLESEGAVRIVGLKQAIQFETRPDGQVEALPYSPDQVCARLSFTGG